MSEKIYSPLIQDPITKKYYRQELKLHEGIVLTEQQFIHELINQQDTLIDDIADLRANNERLERENEQKTKFISLYKKAYEKVIKENEKLKEENTHINQQLKETREFFVDIKQENKYLKDEINNLVDEFEE